MSSYKLPNSLVFFRSKANKMSCEFLLLLLFLRSENLERVTNAENMTVIDKGRRDVRRYCAEEVLMSFINQNCYQRGSCICHLSDFKQRDPRDPKLLECFTFNLFPVKARSVRVQCMCKAAAISCISGSMH